ncbi:MAG: 4Fe-4S dicluster domain-containing protein [bacterium]
MAKLGTLIDTSRCTGCRGCQVACKQWNGLEAEKTRFFGGEGYQNPKELSGKTFTLVYFKEKANGDNFQWLFRKHQCMQCTIASCVNVCPVKALSKHPDGYTVRDREKCIGCGMCVQNCPFKVPRIDEKNKATSCKYCIDRVQNGLTPACAKACPSGAIQFGERDELLKKAKDRVAVLGGKANLYGETQCGGLGVLYILLDDPDIYGLAHAPKTAEIPTWDELVELFSKFSLLSIGSLAIKSLKESADQ